LTNRVIKKLTLEDQ